MKAAHHRGTHQTAARRVTHAAYVNPLTVCCQCQRPLHQCGPHGDGHNANGTHCTWQGGHPDGRWPTPELRPECSWCNQSRGGKTGNARRTTGYNWP